jgi:glycosyltransferase involved in cell wall biosynthesis
LLTHKLVKGDGQGRVNYEIAQAALAAGHDVWLVASEIAPELAGHRHAHPVPISVKGWPSALLKNQVFAARTAFWLLRHRHLLDVVHVNGFSTWARSDVNAVHFVHSAWLRSPYHVWRLRRDWRGLYQFFYSWCGTFLEAWSYRRARAVVAVSRQVERELTTAGVDRNRIRVIANGVDLDEFKPAPASRDALGLPEGVLLLFVGDIKTPRKNLETLLRALTLERSCKLAVVGDFAGSPYPKLVDQLGLTGRVRFLGFRRDIPDLMRSADVFVFPSRYEACSLVLLEAAASGLPVIAARNTGGVELLGDGASILVADPNDEFELAVAVHRLVTSPAVRAQMGAAARRAAEQCSWNAMAQRYLHTYVELSAATPRAADAWDVSRGKVP